MPIEVKVPTLPESVADATIVTWHKKPGDAVKRDENLVDLETDKVVLEVPAPADGVLKEIMKNKGAVVKSDELLAIVEAGQAATAKPAAETAPAKPSSTAAAPAAKASSDDTTTGSAGPSARRAAAEQGVNIAQVSGSGKDGRVTREDVAGQANKGSSNNTATITTTGERPEQRVPMSRLRAKIAERLVSVQQNAALLTTFNEINLKAVMDLRNRYKDNFEKKHGVKLGFMSFFTRAAVEALKRYPTVNAYLDGNDVVYHGFCDVGIAVSTERGLVVPVLRNAERMNFADIERAVGDYGRKARDGQLTIEEMTGGTFTITNGGVFGSLLSTPIINPPQSAILGMHKIEERPIAENGQVVIRPMMYVALSYDHRIIDGKESVGFLVTIKELLEDPARLLLEI